MTSNERSLASFEQMVFIVNVQLESSNLFHNQIFPAGAV